MPDVDEWYGYSHQPETPAFGDSDTCESEPVVVSSDAYTGSGSSAAGAVFAVGTAGSAAEVNGARGTSSKYVIPQNRDGNGVFYSDQQTGAEDRGHAFRAERKVIDTTGPRSSFFVKNGNFRESDPGGTGLRNKFHMKSTPAETDPGRWNESAWMKDEIGSEAGTDPGPLRNTKAHAFAL